MFYILIAKTDTDYYNKSFPADKFVMFYLVDEIHYEKHSCVGPEGVCAKRLPRWFKNKISEEGESLFLYEGNEFNLARMLKRAGVKPLLHGALFEKRAVYGLSCVGE